MKILLISVLVTGIICQKLMAQSSIKIIKRHFIQQKQSADSENNFQILRYDSLENVYVVYARRRDSTIKIVSIKDTLTNCKPIAIGGFYDLKVESLLGNVASPLHAGGVRVGNTLIKLEGRGVIWNLFGSENLKGLCYFSRSQ